VIPKISDFRTTPQSAPEDKERSREGIQRPQKSEISGVRTNRVAIRPRRLRFTFTLCRVFTTLPVETGSVMVATHHLGLESDKKDGRDESRHHHRVGVGHSESTPAETTLPARMVGVSRASVKKRVAEPGSPTLSEPISASTVG